MGDNLCARAKRNWFHKIFSLFNLTLDLGAEDEKWAFRLGKTATLVFSRNLKLIEPDMFSYRLVVTAQWDVFFLPQQGFEFFQKPLRIWAV